MTVHKKLGELKSNLDKNREEFLNKEIEIKTDHAYYKSLKQKLAEIESKVVPVDFSKIEFEDSITNYALEDLSPEAVKKIVEIIREDERNRIENLKKQTESGTQRGEEMIERIKNGGWTPADSTLNLSDTDIDEIEKMEKGAPFDENLYKK